MKTTLNDVLKTIAKWQKQNDVLFFGSFMEFDKTGRCEVKDDRMVCYGDKKDVDIILKEFIGLVKKEKKFINW